jgi:hypothetical protein
LNGAGQPAPFFFALILSGNEEVRPTSGRSAFQGIF